MSAGTTIAAIVVLALYVALALVFFAADHHAPARFAAWLDRPGTDLDEADRRTRGPRR